MHWLCATTATCASIAKRFGQAGVELLEESRR